MSRSAIALLIYAFLAILGGCGHSGDGKALSNSPQTRVRVDLASGGVEGLLRQYVGERITAVGRWNGAGKLSGYVYGDNGSGEEMIYVKATNPQSLSKQTRLEGTPTNTAVEVTGVLHLYIPPNSEPSNSPVPVAPMGKHFYFDVDDANVKFQ